MWFYTGYLSSCAGPRIIFNGPTNIPLFHTGGIMGTDGYRIDHINIITYRYCIQE